MARCQSWPKPQLTKQQVRGVLYEARGDMAEVVADLSGSLSLGFFIQWKQLVLRGWQLIDADSALVKDVLRHRDSRHRVRPSRVKSKMSNDLGELTRLHTVVQCQREV